ncbi:hypothetical protein BpHYR1_037625 [Brachionus plicatilis]|uniref:Uncharacterized protein n=1 Tax=Brachionus plicatilis TaxID=10195 RepID=A0A3M7RXZ9_BRAPC|nr:hypothetical protein BpHYR1_037625 [Brachionus plicatilis]
MAAKDKILFGMKKVLLEYGLRHHLDFLVKSLALNQSSKFSQYNVPQIRFEIFNMYLMIKNREFKHFDSIVSFLNEINSKSPSLIPAPLFHRVVGPLKALKIYECLRVNDLKKACILIKEYFPMDSQAPKDSKEKCEMELKILKKRTHWNELILSKSHRDKYFKDEFNMQYDSKFFAFLMLKVNEIIKIINSYLPLTAIDQVISSGFTGSNLILFGIDEFKLELEDEVRLELFMDNLKLHHIHITSTQCDNFKSSLLNRYLKKLIKLVVNWEYELNCSDNSFVPQDFSQPASNKVILEMLYMNSQMDNIRLENLELSERIDELFEQENSDLSGQKTQTTNLLFNSDLITDDERDINLN